MDEQALKNSRILILAEEEDVTLLRRVLQPVGYLNVEGSGDFSTAVASYDRVQPDLIMIDVSTEPGATALELVHARIPSGDPVPILAIAPVVGVTVRLRSLAMGAKDFLPKPIDDAEALTRVGNLLENRYLQLQVMGGPRLETLADDIARIRTRSLEDIQVELLERFAKTAEYRDFPEQGHRERVAAVARMLAVEMGFPEERADLIGRASLLHDVGKIGVPESIWQKPARLTVQEFEQVKSHTKIGAEILSQGRSPLLWLAEEIAHTHHEHWNGNGYLGLEGDAIPIPGRIVAIADAYDALTTDRPYRKARPSAEALEELTREAGHHFDPMVVDAFLRVMVDPEFGALYAEPGREPVPD
jgi:putative two-component system response regulator